MAPKTIHAVTVVRPTARGDWHATLPVLAFGPKGKNDAEGPFVTLVGEGDDKDTAQVRFGGRGGAILAATDADKQATLVVASVRAMREAVAGGYENDARKGAIPSTVVSVAVKAAKSLSEGATIRKALGRVPASKRVEAAPGILENALKPKEAKKEAPKGAPEAPPVVAAA